MKILAAGDIHGDSRLAENLAKKAGPSKIELVIVEGMEKALKIADILQIENSVDHKVLSLELDDSGIAPLLSALATEKVAYSNISIIQPTLEDFFLHVSSQKEVDREL